MRPARLLPVCLMIAAGFMAGCAKLPDLGGPNPDAPPTPSLQALAPLLDVPPAQATAESAAALAERGKALRGEAKAAD